MELDASQVSSIARANTNPIVTERSMRQVDIRALTSLPAGKMVPLVAFPLLREDRIRSSRMRISFEMMETVEALMNAVNVNVKAYLVPNVAFERFSGMDELNRSYEGRLLQEGGPVTPYFETMVAGAYGSIPIHKYLGLHAAPTDVINVAYIEAYNQIWNFRAKNRSKGLALRTRLQTDLAPAFWQHDGFKHIVPDFDQAVIDGQVALNVVNSQMPVKGIGLQGANTLTNVAVKEAGTPGNQTVNYAKALATRGTNDQLYVRTQASSGQEVPQIFAELQQGGITVSLSNIALAKTTQMFAEMRKSYGMHDDYIIDLLMDGISIPEQRFRQPILLADKNTIFGMSKRYGTDGPNLTKSVVNGMTFIDLDLVTPAIPCGGVVMVVAEITPEQMFERQKDAYLHTTTVAGLPQYLRDVLDPEKVDVVTNGEIETSHATPAAVFGYAPMNWKWSKSLARIGGRFFRPSVTTTFDEDRQRIWAVETANPVLGPDFYLCNNIHTKPFVVTTQDIGESLSRGLVTIEGNTVFGGKLVEANGDYTEVLAEAPQTRIVKP